LEDSTEKLTDAAVEPAALWERARDVAERVRTLALTDPESGAWFAAWRPVFSALMRLAGTLGKLAMRAGAMATTGERGELIDDAFRLEVAEELHDLAADFPDVADVLFGLGNLDKVYRAVVDDEDVRAGAAAIARGGAALLDRFLGALVDIVMGHRESPVGPDRVLAFLERYEAIAQQLLDRWLAPK